MHKGFFVICFWLLSAWAYVPPVSLQVLLKSIYAPTLFSLYSKDVGRLYCELYGVALVAKSFKTQECEITPRKVKEMRHFAMQYVQNVLFLEEQYRVGYLNGWCFLQNGNRLFNNQIIKDGYAVVQHFDLSPQTESLRAQQEHLENIARDEKRGLWKEWEKEMICLKATLDGIAADLQAKEQQASQ